MSKKERGIQDEPSLFNQDFTALLQAIENLLADYTDSFPKAVIKQLESIISKIKIEHKRTTTASYWELLINYTFSSVIIESFQTEVARIQQKHPKNDTIIFQHIAGLLSRLLQEVSDRSDKEVDTFIIAATHELSKNKMIILCGDSFSLDAASFDTWFENTLKCIKNILLSRLRDLQNGEPVQSESALDTFFLPLLSNDLSSQEQDLYIQEEVATLALEIAIEFEQSLEEVESNWQPTLVTASIFWNEYKTEIGASVLELWRFSREQYPEVAAAIEKNDFETVIITLQKIAEKEPLSLRNQLLNAVYLYLSNIRPLLADGLHIELDFSVSSMERETRQQERQILPEEYWNAVNFWQEYAEMICKDTESFFIHLKNLNNLDLIKAARQADWSNTFFSHPEDSITERFVCAVINIVVQLIPGYRWNNEEITIFLEKYFDKDALIKLAQASSRK